MHSICGAHSKSTGQPCKNIAGKGTDHIGEGKCGDHGGLTPIKLYSKVQRTRLGQRMAEILSLGELLQLEPELALAKAMLEQYVELYQSRVEQLRVWYQATSPAFKTLMATKNGSEFTKAIAAFRKEEPLRPLDIPDLVTIGTFLDKIGRLVERTSKVSGICTRDELQNILRQLGDVVAKHVDSETNEKIAEGWKNVSVRGL